MKKLFSLALAFCLCGAANAQTETYFGAEKGSFAVSIDAMPFVNYAGNFFGKQDKNSLSLDASKIAAKYFVTEKFAVAAKLNINNKKDVDFKYEPTYSYIYSDAIGKTTTKTNKYEVALGAQYYFRPGKRVQPYVGASVFVGNDNIITFDENYAYSFKGKDENGTEVEREVEFANTTKTSNPNFYFGVAAELGVEFFVAKNISLSTTLDLGVKTTSNKSIKEYTNTDSETYTAEKLAKDNYKVKNGKNTEFATGLMGGDLSINFYF